MSQVMGSVLLLRRLDKAASKMHKVMAHRWQSLTGKCVMERMHDICAYHLQRYGQAETEYMYFTVVILWSGRMMGLAIML